MNVCLAVVICSGSALVQIKNLWAGEYHYTVYTSRYNASARSSSTEDLRMDGQGLMSGFGQAGEAKTRSLQQELERLKQVLPSSRLLQHA